MSGWHNVCVAKCRSAKMSAAKMLFAKMLFAGLSVNPPTSLHPDTTTPLQTCTSHPCRCVERPDPCQPNPCGPGTVPLKQGIPAECSAQCTMHLHPTPGAVPLQQGSSCTCECPTGTVGDPYTACHRLLLTHSYTFNPAPAPAPAPGGSV